jgi:hypothetical protein
MDVLLSQGIVRRAPVRVAARGGVVEFGLKRDITDQSFFNGLSFTQHDIRPFSLKILAIFARHASKSIFPSLSAQNDFIICSQIVKSNFWPFSSCAPLQHCAIMEEKLPRPLLSCVSLLVFIAHSFH